MPLRAIGYTRVSTARQSQEGISLEAQEAKIRAMAVVHGAELSEVISDGGFSASSLERPGMARLLEMVRSKSIDMVIIAKLDRITRSVRDLAELLDIFSKSKVSLISVADGLDTKSAAGRLVLNIMVSVSQWEREAIGERTRDALQHKKINGERVGTIPYGFKLERDGNRLERNQEEQDIINWINLRRNFQGWTMNKLAQGLNDLGHKTRSGSPWCRQYVKNILKGEK